MPRIPNAKERAQILANIRAEAWRVAEREASESEYRDRQRRELTHLRAFEAAVREVLTTLMVGAKTAPEALEEVYDAVITLNGERGGDRQ